MDVVFHVVGQVVVENVRDSQHVDAAADHVGSDQVLHLAVAERLHDPLAQRLRQVAVHDRHALTNGLELAEQFIRAALGLAEDDALPRLLAVEHARQQVELLVLIHRDVGLADFLDGQLRRREVDVQRAVHVTQGQAQHGVGQRGREQQRLPALGAAAQDALDVGAEADVQHAVGFVEHDIAELVQQQNAAGDEIEDAAGRADGDVDAVADFHRLAADARAAVDRHHLAIGRWHQLAGFIAHLHGQLAGRRQHQGLRAGFIVGAPAVEKRQQKRGGFTGAGLSLANDIAAITCGAN